MSFDDAANSEDYRMSVIWHSWRN